MGKDYPDKLASTTPRRPLGMIGEPSLPCFVLPFRWNPGRLAEELDTALNVHCRASGIQYDQLVREGYGPRA